jgi:hypothetical protein
MIAARSSAAEMYPRFSNAKPALIAPMVAGKKEAGPKIAPEGFMNMAITEPIKAAMPPDMGPRRIPNSGTVITPKVIAPSTPIAIVYGKLLKTVCNAAKTTINAIPFVEKMLRIVLDIFNHPGIFIDV